MKRIITIIIISLFCSGCEDVIQVDTPVGPPRLIIDALIRVNTSEAVQDVVIKVNLTDSFFGKTPATEVDQITITNIDMESSFENPNTMVLLQTEPGVYEASKNTEFFLTGRLILQVDFQGELYIARTQYIPGVPIDSLEQGDASLFEGDETEVIISFTDSPERNDFYLFDLGSDEYLVTEDEFYQGQQFIFSYFYDQTFEAGKEIEIGLLGVDEPFYNYMNQLIVQSGSDTAGPFQTPAATVRGNIINATGIDNIENFDNVGDPDNFALGYFAVCQEFRETLIVE
ncbi:DUF4249 family protein [Zeaxanthinibacter enoshimensis]|uniref:Uncharacterized protein DUF4249 n=1 Tax=Zeaxanthinibacter enoshimensis TaxID=392009 RepID=A0A4V3D3Q7_9FLAO|nr:DUF4249 family protein [Zeaxanthinibacter enoshimensis]TDQ30943.1 uncharacterized protein DUF4249 [Zeaxanthinibacter enoshimensis]